MFIIKLNPDCIKDILLFIENAETFVTFDMILGNPTYSNSTENNILTYKNLYDKYGEEIVLNHLDYCNESELFSGFTSYIDGSIEIKGLSSKGYDFLSNINNNNWQNIKESVLKEISSKGIQLTLNLLIKMVSTFYS